MDLSVVIPAYNEEKALPSTLRSLHKAIEFLKQSEEIEVEVIVVDNLSTDQTRKVAEEGGARVLSCPIRNISAVLNTGYRAAQGKVICRLDADHEMTSDLIFNAWNALKDPSVVGGGCWVEMKSDRKWMPIAADLIQLFFRLQGISMGFVFITKQAYADIGGYPEELLVAEDSAFMLNLRKYALMRKMKFINLGEGAIITKDRKKDLSFLGHLKLFSTIFFFRNTVKQRSKLKYWYDVNR